MAMPRAAPVIRVLELDAELRGRLPPAEREGATDELKAHLYTLQAGDWDPPRELRGHRSLGLLLAGGLVARVVEVAESRCIELLSKGDLLRPWQQDATSFVAVRWRILAPAKAALLTRDFTARACRYPRLVDALVERALQRSRSLAVHSAIDNVVGLPRSLELLFWQLAERWGSVDRDGIVVPLRLTHQTLADLVGARRPSVTAALRDLSASGTLVKLDGGKWRLSGAPPAPIAPR